MVYLFILFWVIIYSLLKLEEFLLSIMNAYDLRTISPGNVDLQPSCLFAKLSMFHSCITAAWKLLLLFVNITLRQPDGILLVNIFGKAFISRPLEIINQHT